MSVSTKTPKAQAKRAAYDDDFYSWLNEQAALLRAHAFDELDIENLAEEIESLGREQFNKLVSAYRIILLHMLKWDHQPTHRSRSWALSVNAKRMTLTDVLEMNPGLKSRRIEALNRAYASARIEAANQTGFAEELFAEDCPYSLDDVASRELRL